MSYSIGDKLQARINKITEKGCFCSFLPLWQNQFGFMPQKFMSSLYDESGNFLKNVGDNIIVVINSITDRGIILSDIATYEKEQEKLRKKEAKAHMQILINDFILKYDIGTVFEAEVIRVQNTKAYITLGGIQGIIKKEDTNWNEIDRLEDLLFEGETINAVYLKHENGQLYFNIKLLNEKPYDENLYNLSLYDLLRYAGHNSNVFIGQAKQYHYGLFIENLYSANENQKGKLLVDPIYGYNLRAIVPDANLNVEEGKFYKIRLKLSQKNKRQERNQLFQFLAINIEETSNPYQNDVKLAFQRNTTNPAANQRDAKLLDEIGKNMYSSKDRMFFELIQNADDAASKKGVLINVKTVGDYLTVKHNGYSFDRDDFVSITTAANGTKKANENKTGYKGIGFKSVFTDSEQVFINTGGYQFKFDKYEPTFQNFDRFYLDNNPMIINDEAKEKFMGLYSDYKATFDGIHSIPWQLEPIWTDRFPEELGTDFVKTNVAIALKLGENKITGNNGYCQAIEDIISNPKFMLFLRNTKRIDFNGKSVSKVTKNGIITLKNSFNVNRIEYFKREDFDIEINNTVFEKNSIDIRIKVDEKDEITGKIIEAKFVDLHNQELENIPKKIAINNYTSISFAVPITEEGKLKLDTKSTEISMFAFLPTLVKDFIFPFYINANFILDPPRQRILGDNPWNFYLMQEIARHLVSWCGALNEKQDKNALNVLVPWYFNEGSTDTKQLAEYFNASYKLALDSEAFILNHKGILSKQSEIIIDKSGLSTIVGSELFCKIIGTEKFLPSDKIDCSILGEKIFGKIETLMFDTVIETISNNVTFNEWLNSAPKTQKDEFYDWVKKKENPTREKAIISFVASLPLFQFGGKYKSHDDIKVSDCIITTKCIASIRSILTKLGFECSDNIFDENHPFFSLIETYDEGGLFNSIKECDFSVLDFMERKELFLALKDFNGVGDAKLKEIVLFKNRNGEFRSLGKMAINEADSPNWLNSYLITPQEYFPEIQKYLIQDNNIFQEIIQTQYTDFENISITELYEQFYTQWTPAFTKVLINKYGANDELLDIVERTDGVQHYFIEKYGRIDLNCNLTKKSIEYRLIKLAFSSKYSTEKLKGATYIDNRNLSQFTVSDDILIIISGKEYHFSLSEVLPNQSEYSSFNQIKELLSDIQGYDALFSLSRMPNSNIRSQLKELSNPAQYVFYICYNIANNYRYPIQITDEQFVSNVLSYCFEKKIDVLSRYIQFLPNQKIIGKFINSDDVTLVAERLSPTIREWADDEEKEKFLISLGAKGSLSDEIKRRKSFINDEPISLSYSSNINSEITAFLNWCITLQTPFTNNNQIKVLREMFSRLNISTTFDRTDYKNTIEWNNKRYIEYVRNKLCIYCINSEMPRRGIYQNIHLYTEYLGDYVYFAQKLYISTNGKNPETLLMSICDDKNIPFTKEDWTKIFLVSVETLNEKENEIYLKEETIKSLSEENRQKDSLINEKDELLNRYRAKYGDLEEFPSERDGINDSEIINKQNTQNEILHSYRDIIERDGLSREEQIAAHKEAEQIVREKLEHDGYDCSNWIIDEYETEYKKWHSVN